MDLLPVNRSSLAAGLRELGVAAGDLLVVHTSLSSFGHVVGNAEAVIGAILDVLGPGGTAMFPAMTWRSSYMRKPESPPAPWIIPYDPATTPADKDMGRVPEAARRYPGALRSSHPLMSVVAIGALAAALTADHPMDDPLRPYRRLADLGGKVLLLGVDHTRNTTVHAAEFLLRLPHLSGPAYALVADASAPGGARLMSMAQEPDCSLGFEALNDLVSRREKIIGGAIAWLCPAQEVVDVALSLLRQDPGALLCDNMACRTCGRGREMYGSRRAEEG